MAKTMAKLQAQAKKTSGKKGAAAAMDAITSLAFMLELVPEPV